MAWTITNTAGALKLNNGESGAGKSIIRIPQSRLTTVIHGTECEFYDGDHGLRAAVEFADVTTTATDWDDLLASIAVPSSSFEYDVSAGRLPDQLGWDKFGYNSDVDTGAPEVIWSLGGSFTILSGYEQMDIASTDAQDTDTTGTGARKVIVYGVTADGFDSEIVNMAGLSNARTTKSYSGLNRISLYDTGSGNVNAGTITATPAVTTSAIQAEMPPGGGTTQQCIFHLPAGYTGEFDWLFINLLKVSGASPIVTIKMWVYSRVVESKFEVFRVKIDPDVENTKELRPRRPFPVGNNAVVWLEAETTASDVEIQARFSLVASKN